MLQASNKPNTLRLSEIARSPVLRAFFARGERDSGDMFAVPATPRRPLESGSVRVERLEVAYA
ncbi:MAG: hypothetical protein RO009_15775 [Pseudorhodoplanes sp.]|jgi:hypothetical protein|nr:hypothetical protein [Pseudorhodoplanes sp.]